MTTATKYEKETRLLAWAAVIISATGTFFQAVQAFSATRSQALIERQETESCVVRSYLQPDGRLMLEVVNHGKPLTLKHWGVELPNGEREGFRIHRTPAPSDGLPKRLERHDALVLSVYSAMLSGLDSSQLAAAKGFVFRTTLGDIHINDDPVQRFMKAEIRRKQGRSDE